MGFDNAPLGSSSACRACPANGFFWWWSFSWVDVICPSRHGTAWHGIELIAVAALRLFSPFPSYLGTSGVVLQRSIHTLIIAHHNTAEPQSLFAQSFNIDPLLKTPATNPNIQLTSQLPSHRVPFTGCSHRRVIFGPRTSFALLVS